MTTDDGDSAAVARLRPASDEFVELEMQSGIGCEQTTQLISSTGVPGLGVEIRS